MSVTVNGVSVRFGDRLVLDDITFDVPTGSMVALEGPSGCGKTTLLNVIGGMLKPTDGYVERPPLGEIQWILQTSNVLGRRTALDNAMLGLFARGLTRRDARPIAFDALTSVGLSQQAGERISRLSGGEVQRVALVRTLIPSPALVLADEPTGQLDRDTTLLVVDAFRRLLAGHDSTVIVATHDRAVAAACDRRLHLLNGRIEEAQ